MPTDPKLDSWLHGLLARLHCLEGNSDAEIDDARRSVQFAKRSDSEFTQNVRNCDFAAVLQYSGRPAEALDQIMYSDTYDPESRMHTQLMHATILADLGEGNEARAMVSRLSSMVDDFNFGHFKEPVAQLILCLEE